MGMEIVGPGRMADRGSTLQGEGAEVPRRAPVALAICGDPIVGRALALVLQGPRYETRFVSASSLEEVASLEGVSVLLLTPTLGLSTVRREALLAALGEATAVAGITMLELVAFREQAAPKPSQISWPCSSEQLERRIEEALCAEQGAYRGPCRAQPSRKGEEDP